MRLTYIDHSGVMLETAKATLLFDFVKGTLPDIPKDKPLYVFVSHAHGDHYAKRVFGVAHAADKAGAVDVRFLLSDDISARDVPAALKKSVTFLRPHEAWEDVRIQVKTLLSNDAGVAFCISVPDQDTSEADVTREIYFAGDLNAWNWDGDAEDLELIAIYHKELESIKGKRFDVAFIPLDPRLGEERIQGITDFFEAGGCDADVLVPMHCWGDYGIITQAIALQDKFPYMNRLLMVKHGGERFDI